jgi:DeoR/GlpR family transcriptional regulator of sugar metabolism
MNSHFTERKEKLLELIHQKKHLTIKELSKYFDVSAPTLYRDLKTLEEEKVIQRYHGVIRYVDGKEKDHGYFYRAETDVKEKQYIVKKAIKLINSGDNIFIDASTTSLYLCKELKKSNIEYLTVFTNGLLVPNELLKINNFNIIDFGGVLDREVVSFVKNEPRFFLENIKYLKYFGSAYAFSLEFGAMDQFGLEEIEVKKKVLQFCNEIVLLMVSNKFNLKGTYNWLEVDKVSKIVTDTGVDKKIVDYLSVKGVDVIY